MTTIEQVKEIHDFILKTLHPTAEPIANAINKTVMKKNVKALDNIFDAIVGIKNIRTAIMDKTTEFQYNLIWFFETVAEYALVSRFICKQTGIDTRTNPVAPFMRCSFKFDDDIIARLYDIYYEIGEGIAEGEEYRAIVEWLEDVKVGK